MEDTPTATTEDVTSTHTTKHTHTPTVAAKDTPTETSTEDSTSTRTTKHTSSTPPTRYSYVPGSTTFDTTYVAETTAIDTTEYEAEPTTTGMFTYPAPTETARPAPAILSTG